MSKASFHWEDPLLLDQQLTDDERMVRDAEVHADEDKKFHELVTARNQADGLLHATKKALEDLGDKVEAGERADIEAAMNDLKEALGGDDKAKIEARAQKLAQAAER